MKSLLLATVFAAGMATVAVAGGLSTAVSDPVVVAPAAVAENWTGAYAGLSYGRTDTDLLEPTENDIGGFAGYRHNFGAFVAGGELAANSELASLEAQAGYDFGTLLPYVFVGYGETSNDVLDESGTVYGLGVDAAVNKNVFMGVKYTAGDFDNSDVSSTQFRIGYKF